MPDFHRLSFAIVFGTRVVRYRLNTHLPTPHHFPRGSVGIANLCPRLSGRSLCPATSAIVVNAEVAPGPPAEEAHHIFFALPLTATFALDTSLRPCVFTLLGTYDTIPLRYVGDPRVIRAASAVFIDIAGLVRAPWWLSSRP